MFARCTRPQLLRVSRPSHIRYESSTPERIRRWNGSENQLPFQQYYKSIAILLGTSATVYAGYTLYTRQQYQDSFVKYELVNKEPVSSSSSIFYLKPREASKELDKYKEAWKSGIWNVQFKQPQLQIVRAYTPLPPIEVANKNDPILRFLIRHDPYGEVSSYLHKLRAGADIEVRGPNLEYPIPEDVRQVIFMAGGTGIAPALQVAHCMFDGRQQDTSDKARRLHILWANRKREDCSGGVSDEIDSSAGRSNSWTNIFSGKSKLAETVQAQEKGVLVRELETLKARYPGQITVEYYVNEELSMINEQAVTRALSVFDDQFTENNDRADQRQVIISGPPGFIAYIAGPKEWRGGMEEQGVLARLLAHGLAKCPHNVKVWKV